MKQKSRERLALDLAIAELRTRPPINQLMKKLLLTLIVFGGLALNATSRILHGHNQRRTIRRLHQFRRTLVTLEGSSGHYDIWNSGTADAGLK
jgi:hypothetical protein